MLYGVPRVVKKDILGGSTKTALALEYAAQECKVSFYFFLLIFTVIFEDQTMKESITTIQRYPRGDYCGLHPSRRNFILPRCTRLVEVEGSAALPRCRTRNFEARTPRQSFLCEEIAL